MKEYDIEADRYEFFREEAPEATMELVAAIKARLPSKIFLDGVEEGLERMGAQECLPLFCGAVNHIVREIETGRI